MAARAHWFDDEDETAQDDTTVQEAADADSTQ